MDAHLLIVDDYRLLTESLEVHLGLQHDFVVHKSVCTTGDLLAYLKSNAIDVLLFSVCTNCLDWKSTCKAIRYQFPELKIILYACDDNLSILQEFLPYRIQGYIHKAGTIEELLIAIRLVYEGKEYYSKQITHRILQLTSNKPHYKTGKTLLQPISQREKQVLKLVLEEFTTEEIANTLCISIHTVETHRSNLFSKLNVRNVAGLVKKTIEYNILGNEAQLSI